jgi:hypothetical protein
MKLLRYMGKPSRGTRVRTSRSKQRFEIASYHFWGKCLDLITVYESLQQKYNVLEQDHCSSVISESEYLEGFREIMDQYESLICDYGKNIDQFINSGIKKQDNIAQDKIKGILDLYLLIQKEYIIIVNLYNLLLLNRKAAASPRDTAADSTLLVNVPAAFIQRYMKRKNGH